MHSTAAVTWYSLEYNLKSLINCIIATVLFHCWYLLGGFLLRADHLPMLLPGHLPMLLPGKSRMGFLKFCLEVFPESKQSIGMPRKLLVYWL